MRRGHYAASVTRLAVSQPVDRFTVQLLDGGRVVATRWPAHGERIRAFRLDGFLHPLLAHRMLDLMQVAGAYLRLASLDLGFAGRTRDAGFLFHAHQPAHSPALGHLNA